MKLIWHGMSPIMRLGYGVVTREIASRIKKAGHEVIIASRTDDYNYDWNGIQVIDGKYFHALNDYINEDLSIDYTLSPQDPWEDARPFRNWVALAPLDIEFLFTDFADKIRKSKFQFCVSQHNLKEFRKFKMNPFYCPYGVNTSTYIPDISSRERFRNKNGFKNHEFVIGSIGQNMYSDRKNFTGLLRAFAYFAERHDNARLYLHTNVGKGYTSYSDFICASRGWDPWLKLLIDKFQIADKVKFVNQSRYWQHMISDEEMIETYNGIDVFCLPTKGESFGLPILEAQSCGTPVVVTNTTACPELTKYGWLIPVEEDDYQYTDTNSFCAVPRPKEIAATLEFAYDEYERGVLQKHGLQASTLVKEEYDWDFVFDKYWVPFLNFLEENK